MGNGYDRKAESNIWVFLIGAGMLYLYWPVAVLLLGGLFVFWLVKGRHN